MATSPVETSSVHYMISSSDSFPSPTKRPKTLAKGKSKLEEAPPMGSDSDCCGICWSEEGRAIRGHLDCCGHYFCFVCIMEWAKVESRCPMCKRRFSIIRRPPKVGVFSCERIVNVPIRDQVFHPLGNMTDSLPDPYSHVCCTVCLGMEDESLLLLCDLCDSASHTYCVGLGVTVPDGDWFCHDCAASRNEHCSGGPDSVCESPHVSEKVKIVPLAEASVPAKGIAGKPNICRVERPCGPVSHDSRSCDVRTSEDDGDRAIGSSARTLHRCRNVRSRIRAFRENWNSLRSGSLRFSSSFINSCGVDDSSTNTSQGKNSYDVEKAWKMMEIAKSKLRATVQKGNSFKAQNCAVPKKFSHIHAVGRSRSLGDCASERECNYGSSLKAPHRVINMDGSHRNAAEALQHNLFGKKSGIAQRCYGSSCLVSPVESISEASDLANAQRDLNARDEKHGVRIASAENKMKEDENDAKSEIKSLVKLNLKLLSRKKHLGVEKFKEIARLATHSILVACGLEPPKSGLLSPPSSVCFHSEQTQHLHKSTLMPGSCRECFYVFVKDVVYSLIEKNGGL